MGAVRGFVGGGRATTESEGFSLKGVHWIPTSVGMTEEGWYIIPDCYKEESLTCRTGQTGLTL
jgi:hypothetical protein